MDNKTNDIRHKIMQSIRSSDSLLERRVRSIIWHNGIRYRKNVITLYGKPDIAIKKYKLVIFIDSCFWHGCLEHFRMPKSNLEYWRTKIDKNKIRDAQIIKHYKNINWNIFRLWEHELIDPTNSPKFNELLALIRNLKIKI